MTQRGYASRPACPGTPTQLPRSHGAQEGSTLARLAAWIAGQAHRTTLLAQARSHRYSGTASQLQGQPKLATAWAALGVEELLAVTWAGDKVVVPASLAQVEVPTASPHQAEMLMPLLQGLGASAKLFIHDLAVDALALAAALQLSSWNWHGDYRPLAMEEILCSRDSCWLPADIPRPRGWDRVRISPATARRPMASLARLAIGETRPLPPGLRLHSDLCHDAQLRAELASRHLCTIASSRAQSRPQLPLSAWL